MGQNGQDMWDGMSRACGTGWRGVWDASRMMVGPVGVCWWGYLGRDGGHGVRGATSANDEIKNVAMLEWWKKMRGT